MNVRVDRLRRRADFVHVAASRLSCRTPGLVLQAAAAPAADRLRVGFTVSRRVGGAVERNRAKRRLRALAAQILPAHGALGRDYVLIGRPATLDRDFAELGRDLETALHRLGLWRNDDAAHPPD